MINVLDAPCRGGGGGGPGEITGISAGTEGLGFSLFTSVPDDVHNVM